MAGRSCRVDRKTPAGQIDQLQIGAAGVKPIQGIGGFARTGFQDDRFLGWARVCGFSRQDLAEDGTEPEDVGPLVDGREVALGLFGRHVGRCSEHRASLRLAGLRGRPHGRDHTGRGLGAGFLSIGPTVRGKTLARPQSITWTSPKLPTMMFDGFKSRWITPREWA